MISNPNTILQFNILTINLSKLGHNEHPAHWLDLLTYHVISAGLVTWCPPPLSVHGFVHHCSFLSPLFLYYILNTVYTEFQNTNNHIISALKSKVPLPHPSPPPMADTHILAFLAQKKNGIKYLPPSLHKWATILILWSESWHSN